MEDLIAGLPLFLQHLCSRHPWKIIVCNSCSTAHDLQLQIMVCHEMAILQRSGELHWQRWRDPGCSFEAHLELHIPPHATQQVTGDDACTKTLPQSTCLLQVDVCRELSVLPDDAKADCLSLNAAKQAITSQKRWRRGEGISVLERIKADGLETGSQIRRCSSKTSYWRRGAMLLWLLAFMMLRLCCSAHRIAANVSEHCFQEIIQGSWCDLADTYAAQHLHCSL
mmetsp:Transcript_71663/g.171282  ORF Transcript_71663/g.171282 Transcript_71663/m.171282 type:complete len:225 (+) Transcript_71663:1467-2141(+)